MRWVHTFPCQNLAPFVSPTLPVSPFLNGRHCGAEIRNEFTFSVAKTFRPLCSNSLKWREPCGERSKTQDKNSNPAQSYCSSLRKNEINEYQKLLEIEKEIVHAVARGDKPYLRKSTDRKAQIRKAFVQLSRLICALRSVDFFSGKVYHPEPPHAQCLFLFPIVFGINSLWVDSAWVSPAKRSDSLSFPFLVWAARHFRKRSYSSPHSFAQQTISP